MRLERFNCLTAARISYEGATNWEPGVLEHGVINLRSWNRYIRRDSILAFSQCAETCIKLHDYKWVQLTQWRLLYQLLKLLNVYREFGLSHGDDAIANELGYVHVRLSETVMG